MVFTDYIVYVDESGDHSLQSIDAAYPVFVLAFCIFDKTEYRTVTVPALQAIKFKYFGHDMTVLHEYDIRRSRGPFRILRDPNVRQSFLGDIEACVSEADFTVIAMVINKQALIDTCIFPDNPYALAMTFGLERLHLFLKDRGEADATTYLVAESRGAKEDKELEFEFLKACHGENYKATRFPFQLQIADKKCNSCGLQLADLIARPIGRHVIDSVQDNRAYEVIKGKFYRKYGRFRGYGLKAFP